MEGARISHSRYVLLSYKGQRIIEDLSDGGQSGKDFYGGDLGITFRDNYWLAPL
jgi:hypothetical protein